MNVNNYSLQDIQSTEYYVIMWMPKLQLKVVQGQFIRGHFDKCMVLTQPHKLKDKLKSYLMDNRDYLKGIYLELSAKKVKLIQDNQKNRLQSRIPAYPSKPMDKVKQTYYTVYSYETALGLNIRKSNIDLYLSTDQSYTPVHLMNMLAKILLKQFSVNEVQVNNLVIINYIKL